MNYLRTLGGLRLAGHPGLYTLTETAPDVLIHDDTGTLTHRFPSVTHLGFFETRAEADAAFDRVATARGY